MSDDQSPSCNGRDKASGRFAKGHSFGKGRAKGTRDKATRLALEAAKNGGELPLEYLLRIMRDPDASLTRRDYAAAAAAPYLHPRRGSVSTISRPFDLPAPRSPAEAIEGLAALAAKVAAGEVDLESANAIGAALKAYLDQSGRVELEAEVAELRQQMEAMGKDDRWLSPH